MNFNYQKAYFTLAKPAFLNLNDNQKAAFCKLSPLVGELSQGQDLNIPLNDDMDTILHELSCKEIAELSRTSNFVGHWRPSNTESIFENSKGQSWKIANVCDQILRKRLETPRSVLIYDGVFRVKFSNKDCWLWEEFGLATEENLTIFNNSGLSFGEDTLEKSAKILAGICGDLWPDVETIPNNKEYLAWLQTMKTAELEELKYDYQNTLKTIEKKIEDAKTELTAFTWLVENDIDINNCIYDAHMGVFCFGWRTPLQETEKEAIEIRIKGFPFKYEYK